MIISVHVQGLFSRQHVFQHRKHKREILGNRLSSEIGSLFTEWVYTNGVQQHIFPKGCSSVCLFTTSPWLFPSDVNAKQKRLILSGNSWMLVSRNQRNKCNYHCWNIQFCDSKKKWHNITCSCSFVCIYIRCF